MAMCYYVAVRVSLGFKGARKGTPFAASQIAATLAKDMSTMGIRNVEVNMQGPGSGEIQLFVPFRHRV